MERSGGMVKQERQNVAWIIYISVNNPKTMRKSKILKYLVTEGEVLGDTKNIIRRRGGGQHHPKITCIKMSWDFE